MVTRCHRHPHICETTACELRALSNVILSFLGAVSTFYSLYCFSFFLCQRVGRWTADLPSPVRRIPQQPSSVKDRQACVWGGISVSRRDISPPLHCPRPSDDLDRGLDSAECPLVTVH